MISMKLIKCLRCGNEWLPRVLGKPKMCPACKSRVWDKAKEAKK